MNLVQYDKYLINAVGTDGLVLQHHGIRTHSAEQLFMG